MATLSFDHHVRLEPDPDGCNFEKGFAAEVHDPVWFLSRQWQMGEHQGENATTPVLVTYHANQTPLKPYGGDTRLDPTVVPAEAIIESEQDDWWTMGRRIKVGSSIAQKKGLVATPTNTSYRFSNPPPPYEKFESYWDGRALWSRDGRADLGLKDEDFQEFAIPSEKPYLWDSEELVYSAAFDNDIRRLTLPHHHGGYVDWYAADGDTDAVLQPVGTLPEGMDVHPAPVEYPGAPRSRWWEIEDGAKDIGGYPPDSSHVSTTLLIDLIASHSNDWFLFPVNTNTGHIVTLQKVIVTDSFGRQYEVMPPEEDWSLFKTTNLDKTSFVVWLTTVSPLIGQPVENVLLGIDEYANYLWAVERKINGLDIDSAPLPPDYAEQLINNPLLDISSPHGDTTRQKEYMYIPGKNAARFWHPYEIEDTPKGRRFVQRRLADFARTHPVLLPKVRAEVLTVVTHGTPIIHEVEPATIPVNGLELERRWILARDRGGHPMLWVQRKRMPRLSPPARTIRFDVMEES